MKRLMLLALLCADPSGAAPSAPAPVIIPVREQDRAWQERFRLFSVAHHQGMNYWGVCLQVTLFMVENGPKGNPMGHDNMLTNLEAYACPAIPSGDRRIAAATIAINKSLASFVLSDEYRRKEYFKWFAAYYHAGGPGRDPSAQAENNAGYAKMLGEVWRQRTMPWMKAHGIDKMRTHDLQLFLPNGLSPSGTVWQPAVGM